jgi:hypothetical protein
MSMIEGVLMGMAARTKQQTDAEDRAYLKKKRAEEDEDRAFTMSERQRAVQLRTDMSRAAATVAPVEIKQDRPAWMDDRDVSAVGEAPLPTAGYDVAGKRFATMADATKAATEVNTPQAVTARMSDVLMRNGDPVRAQQLRVGAMQEKTAGLTLAGAERNEARSSYLDDLHKAVPFGDWDAAAAFMNKSGASPQQGRIVLSADGKKRTLEVQKPDGTFEEKGSFDNTPEGFMELGMRLERAPLDVVQKHLHQKAQLTETGRHNKQVEDIARDKTAANIEIAQIRADAAAERRAAAAKAAGAKPSGLDMDAADKFINALFTSKDETTGAHTFNPKGADAVRGLLPRMPAAQGGDTQGAVNQALTIYQTALKNAGGDHDKAVAMIRQATAPKPQQAVQPSIPTTAKPTSGAVTMAGRAAAAADPLADDKRWVMNKLMAGAFDSDAKLAEIARSNANPKFRAAAAELLKERRQRAENFGEEVQSQPL